jgi:hypothetical protein
MPFPQTPSFIALVERFELADDEAEHAAAVTGIFFSTVRHGDKLARGPFGTRHREQHGRWPR